MKSCCVKCVTKKQNSVGKLKLIQNITMIKYNDDFLLVSALNNNDEDAKQIGSCIEVFSVDFKCA